jgi:CRP/FNR family cyclic AMP-dependent transcriptional regulator
MTQESPIQNSSAINFHSMQHCQSCRMQEHLLLHQLTPVLRDELSNLCFRVSLPAGATVFREGDAPNGVLILRKGRTKVTMNSPEGRTVILYLAAPGEILGLSSVISNSRRQVTAISVEPCELDLVRRDDFLAFLNGHEDQFRAALDELAMQHTCILEAIRRLSLAPSLVANVARFLLGLNCPESMEQSDKIQLKVTQEEIAQQLGTTRESVTRTLSKLRKERVIDQRGHTLTIRNRAMLEHLAGAGQDEAALKLA